MYSKLKSVLRTLLYFSIIFWALSSGNPFAKPAAKGESPKESVSTQTAQTSENKIDSPQVEAEKKDTHAPKEKAVDKAGERVGQQIDKFSRSASLKIGKWIEVEIFAGITWLKMLLCLLLTFLVVMVERLIRWLINSAIRKMPAEEET
ncbi:MAG: hypothetical protein MUO88_06075, partial [Desulfobacterales bacterium]|nr:hypothetical protein [Desulfobacterales bacterium]